jgi:hypothetical protein
MAGLRRAPCALREVVLTTLPAQPPLLFGEQIVPTKTTPPALTAGTERGFPLG